MDRFCYEHGGKIDGGWRQNYGYIIETENYRYCLRCSPGQGDYHAYLSCFDLNLQRVNLAKESTIAGELSATIRKRGPEPAFGSPGADSRKGCCETQSKTSR